MNELKEETFSVSEKSCWKEIVDGNKVDPSHPYCDLPENHTGRHSYVCGHETMDGNYDDPTFAYCKLPAFHAGVHEHVF